MSNVKGYPHKQPFNLKEVTKNKTKSNSWWQHPPNHNNRRKRDDE